MTNPAARHNDEFTRLDLYTEETREETNEIQRMIEEAWTAYVAQPVNFGDDDYETRLAEHDAFCAGALAMLSMKIPF